MNAAHKNECPVAAGQVANTQSKSSHYFIAVCAMLGSPTGGMVAALAVSLVQVVLNMPDVFAGLDWAGLVALGGVTGTPAVFTGTDNPRHLRVIQALMTRPLPREQLDDVAGCSNGPELVAELRRRGLELECTRTKKKDRDLFDCWPGVYHFTQQDRRRVIQWLAKRKAGGANHA